jgi:hypothetical protein
MKRTSHWHTSTEIRLGCYENRPDPNLPPLSAFLRAEHKEVTGWQFLVLCWNVQHFRGYAVQRVWDPVGMEHLESSHDHARDLSWWPNKGLGVFVAQQCCRIYQHIMHLVHRHLRMSHCSWVPWSFIALPQLIVEFGALCMQSVGRDSVVGITTRCWLGGPGIESRWGRDFPHPSRPALGPTQPTKNGYRVSFPGVNRPGRGVAHLPHQAPRFK